MKNIIILLTVSTAGIIMLSSCRSHWKPGNGKVTTEDRNVGAFNTVTIEGLFPVEITQAGDKEYVKVQTDQNLQSQISVKTEGNELIIKTENDETVGKSTKTKVFINVKDLKELDFKSVGSLSTNGIIKLDSLNLNSESVGKLKFDMDANYLHANLSSVGSTTLSGKVKEARINNKSVGSLSAFDLKAATMMIHNTALGITEVYADSAFYIRSSAVGALYYKGPGQLKELKSEGIGVVQKKE
jgi:Putative auto-transporter adhesin, head GIN domain